MNFLQELNYRVDRWLDNCLGGHISIGEFTIWGRNAMRWAITFRMKKYGYICFNLPFIPVYGKFTKFYFYISTNGTPGASTFYYGPSNIETKLSKLRKRAFGHGFDYYENEEDLYYINNYGKIPQHLLRNEKIKNILDL
jgi:hypothetical protein